MSTRDGTTSPVEPVLRWSFDEGSGTTVVESETGERSTVEYVFADAADAHDDALWVSGVDGSALCFDGYSTWIDCATDQLASLDDELTVEAWVAPRSFGGDESERLDAIVNQHDHSNDQGFEFGTHQHGRWSLQVGTGDDWVTVWADDDALSPFEWAHLVGVYDGDDGEIALYLNGSRVATRDVDDPKGIDVADEPLRIGKNNDPTSVGDVFDLDTFDGAMDELAVYDEALTAGEIAANYRRVVDACGGAVPAVDETELALDPAVYEGDPHRPGYHPIAPGHWMNEPHAPLYYDGQYHLFYQANPRGPYWGNIHWGHWVSDDLVEWRHLPIALRPEAGDLDPDGIWSGNATYDADGEPVLFYTAGNMDETPDQRVATARPANVSDPDLVDWEKDGEVVMEKPRRLGLRENDFRDPFLWREDDTWYCLVGAGERGNGGAALVYTSKTLEEWQCKGQLYRSDYESYPELGQVWELPILLSLGEDDDGDEKHVFIVSPVGAGADVEVYYWLGEWDADDYRFVPDDDEPRRLDYGDFGFTGPSAMVDPKTDRPILFTIAQDQRRGQDHYDSGWAHNGGLPVRLFLEDGDLGLEPIGELATLRDERLASADDVSLSAADAELDGVEGDMLELSVKMRSTGAEKMGLRVRATPDGQEATRIVYDDERGELSVHRERSSRSLDVQSALAGHSELVHTAPLDSSDDGVELRVFLDRSMLECYVDAARSVTTRVYPERDDATGVSLWADGDAIVDELRVWRMAATRSE